MKTKTRPSTPAPANHGVEMRLPGKPSSILILPIDSLLPPAWNPPERKDPDGPERINELLASIQQTGICTPLYVSPPDREGMRRIWDGNRRHTACVKGGYTHMECIEYSGDFEQLFALLNSNVKPHTSRQKLGSYLIAPRTVTPYMQRALGAMLTEVGRDAMQETYVRGGSYATFKQARDIAYYCELGDDRAFVRQALLWLVRFKGTCAARQYMDGGRPREGLWAAVEKQATLPG